MDFDSTTMTDMGDPAVPTGRMGSMGGPMAAMKKPKSYTTMIIVAAVCCCCCLIVGIGAYLYFSNQKKQETTETDAAEAETEEEEETGATGTGTGTGGTGTGTGTGGTGSSGTGSGVASGTAGADTTTPTTTKPPTCGGATSQYTFPYGNTLKPGQTLTQCQGLKSQNGGFILVVQSDGNMIVWDTQSKDGIWSSNTYGASAPPYRLVYESGGNIVLFGGPGHVIWHNNSAGLTSTKFVLHNDGHLVLYNGNTVVRSSMLMDCGGSTAAWRVPYGDRLKRGYTLPQCSALKSPDGKKVLAVQSDGNVIMWDGTNGVWSSNTSGAGVGPYRLVYEASGNVVLFNEANQVLWQTHTSNKESTQLILQDDKNLVLYNGNPAGNSNAAWASNWKK